jgi:peptide/histidine transporter 3/4
VAYYGISYNLVTYLTGVLGQSNVAAARNVSTWQATCFLMPLAGAVVADSYWGRYRTMVVSCSVGVAVRLLTALPTTVHHSSPESIIKHHAADCPYLDISKLRYSDLSVLARA